MRWIRVDVKGNCLAPKMYNRQTVDARVDFDFEEIEVDDYVTYLYGTTYQIKRVLGRGRFYLAKNKVLLSDRVVEITDKSLMRLQGYDDKALPKECILVGSYLTPDPWVRVVHQDSIKYLTKKTDL